MRLVLAERADVDVRVEQLCRSPGAGRVAVARVVVVFRDGGHERRQVAAARVEAVVALGNVPTEVQSTQRAGGDAIDLLPRALADVTDPQVAGGRVEAVA